MAHLVTQATGRSPPPTLPGGPEIRGPTAQKPRIESNMSRGKKANELRPNDVLLFASIGA